MQVKSGTIIAIIGAIIAIIIVMAKWCNPGPNVAYFPQDTVYIEKFTIRHDTVTKTQIKEKPVYVIRVKDSLIYVVEKGHVDTVDFGQLSTRKYPRMIFGEFQKGFLKFTSMDTTGLIYTDNYIVDFDTRIYRYNSLSRSLTSDLLPKTTTGDDFSNDFDLGPNTLDKLKNLKGVESNAYLLYDPFRRNIALRVDASWNFRKFGLYLFGQGNTVRPTGEAGLGIRYRIR